jgi:beta-phosphoglucomutase-like phosphatase (HAD superfamily)
VTGLVIFDNDGVLVDSERLANTILAELLTEAGLPYTFEEAVRDFMGGSMVSMRQKAEARLGRALPADLEDRYHQRLFDGFANLRAIEGVAAVLDHLDATGTPYCLASSGTHRRIHTALTTVGFWDRSCTPRARSAWSRPTAWWSRTARSGSPRPTPPG